MSENWTYVCAIGELPPGEMRTTWDETTSVPILVFNYDGDYYALEDRCSHEEFELSAGNYDADDLDEWLTMQRDWQVDGGIEPVSENAVIAVRRRAALAVQAVFDDLAFPPISDAEIEAATLGYDSNDMPDRDRAASDRVGHARAEPALGEAPPREQ